MKIVEYDTTMELFMSVPKGGIGAEIGVCKGGNAIRLWQITKPKKLHLCDIWKDNELPYPPHEDPNLWYDNHEDMVRNIFSEEIDQGSVEIHKEWGGNFLYSLPDEYLDWVYLDADHHYDPVNIELNIAVNKVKQGGLIMGHDYMAHPTVWRTGVIRAVNEKINEGLIEMIGISIERFSSYVCRVI